MEGRCGAVRCRAVEGGSCAHDREIAGSAVVESSCDTSMWAQAPAPTGLTEREGGRRGDTGRGEEYFRFAFVDVPWLCRGWYTCPNNATSFSYIVFITCSRCSSLPMSLPHAAPLYPRFLEATLRLPSPSPCIMYASCTTIGYIQHCMKTVMMVTISSSGGTYARCAVRPLSI